MVNASAQEQRAYDEKVRKVERRFADLSLNLQRAVQEAKDEARETTTREGYYGFFVPHQEWDEVVKALDEIHKYAREVAFGEGTGEQEKPKEHEQQAEQQAERYGTAVTWREDKD